METISKAELEELLRTEQPENNDREQGYALVNVLSQENFREGHIPHSINIPKAYLSEFERRFEKSKELVLYCASQKCDASRKSAEELEKQGFTSVVVYEGGMEEWRNSGNPVDGLSAAARDAQI